MSTLALNNLAVTCLFAGLGFVIFGFFLGLLNMRSAMTNTATAIKTLSQKPTLDLEQAAGGFGKTFKRHLLAAGVLAVGTVMFIGGAVGVFLTR